MKGCLVNSRVLILVNGNPINEFLVSKRLRQGDLLTAFLFNTVAECLCVCVGLWVCVCGCVCVCRCVCVCACVCVCVNNTSWISKIALGEDY